jgi:hypothetical protein
MLFLAFSNMLNLSRPKELPPLVPDCGWNHGEMKKGSDAKNGEGTYHRPTSPDASELIETADTELREGVAGVGSVDFIVDYKEGSLCI